MMDGDTLSGFILQGMGLLLNLTCLVPVLVDGTWKHLPFPPIFVALDFVQACFPFILLLDQCQLYLIVLDLMFQIRLLLVIVLAWYYLIFWWNTTEMDIETRDRINRRRIVTILVSAFIGTFCIMVYGLFILYRKRSEWAMNIIEVTSCRTQDPSAITIFFLVMICPSWCLFLSELVRKYGLSRTQFLILIPFSGIHFIPFLVVTWYGFQNPDAPMETIFLPVHCFTVFIAQSQTAHLTKFAHWWITSYQN